VALLRRLLEPLGRLPPALGATLNLALVGVLAPGDYWTGADIAFTALYLVPIAAGAWFGSRRWSLAPSEQGWVALEVRDDGPSISAALRPHVFEPFVTTKDVGEGSGWPRRRLGHGARARRVDHRREPGARRRGLHRLLASLRVLSAGAPKPPGLR